MGMSYATRTQHPHPTGGVSSQEGHPLGLQDHHMITPKEIRQVKQGNAITFFLRCCPSRTNYEARRYCLRNQNAQGKPKLLYKV